MKKERELLHSITKNDFTIQPFKGSGPGGQHRNKNATAIRLIHNESGVQAESQKHKSQRQNRKEAFNKLINSPEFRKWHRIKTAEALFGKNNMDRQLNEWMRPENFQIEYL